MNTMQAYQTIFENAPDLILIVDGEGRIVQVNSRVEATLGYSSEELIGASIGKLIPARFAGAHAESVKRYFASPRMRPMGSGLNLFIMRKDGSEFPVDIMLGAAETDEGKVVVAIVRDITERMMAEAALLENWKLFQSILDASSTAIHVKDLKGRYILANRRFEEIYGVRNTDLVGKQDQDFPPNQYSLSRSARENSVLASGKPQEIEEEVGQLGGPRIFSTKIYPLRNEQNAVYAVCTLSNDVTDHRHMEEQLRQSLKMEAIGRLAGGVAHDFNNLLTVINGNSNLLLSGMGRSNPFHARMTEILHAGERAAELTQQLLTYSRRQYLEPKVWDLNQIVSEAEALLRRLIGEGIEMATHLSTDRMPVRVDRGQLEQILLNLVVNARDAMPAGGALDIWVDQVFLDQTDSEILLAASPGPFVVLSVEDSGVGMDAETQARMWDPFFTTKGWGAGPSVRSGTGLGLAVVYGIVKQSGGSISVRSRLGKGTAIRIYIPRSSSEMNSLPDTTVETADEPIRGTGNILVVEDEPSVRKLICDILSSSGYRISSAENGKNALELLEKSEVVPDLIVTDVTMPKMNGLEMAKRILLSHPALPILFVSGYSEPPAMSYGGEAFIQNWLQKPFSSLQLLQKVKSLLAQYIEPIAHSQVRPKPM